MLKVIFNETRPLVAGKFPAIASANVKEDEQDVEVKKKKTKAMQRLGKDTPGLRLDRKG